MNKTILISIFCTVILISCSGQFNETNVKELRCKVIPLEITTPVVVTYEKFEKLETKDVVVKNKDIIDKIFSNLKRLPKTGKVEIDTRYKITIVYKDKTQNVIYGGYNYILFNSQYFIVDDSLRELFILNGF